MRSLLIVFFCGLCFCAKEKLREVTSWKQITYNIHGVLYKKDADVKISNSSVYFVQDVEDLEKYFIQYNNVPVGFEVYSDRVFVTVPRRRYGIPSTLNYIKLDGSPAPPLRPYPSHECDRPISVYRPRVDACHRLWIIDTGLLEVPNGRKQLKPPAILVYDLHTNKQILRYQLKATDLVNERTSAGLTSITVDVNPQTCNDAYAYINDLATNGLIVFSMRERDSWRIDHTSFVHDEAALNFTVADNTINWKDGLFSIALSDPRADGSRTAYYHPLISTQEFFINTENLKKKTKDIKGLVTPLGDRGRLTQSGSHDYHAQSKTLLFANVAQDAILCWNVATSLKPKNVAIVAQDHEKLVYISDLKVVGDDVWVLVNQIPRIVYSNLNPLETNYYIHRGYIPDLIRGTACDNLNKSN
ncbi:L-dopachrome tautomerase yellow-f2-like [Amyelois transitella]|uniref:L-dopachrome tautomerase yellow-f2-like n=1 Tax=Amyelois transitella TaxID=680683 RepID=UPI00298FACEE|nr:L-dopachrome tautomerase yellow-f2-like [Amyelois transitella]